MKGGKFKLLRPRVVLYPAVLAVLASLFTFVLMNTGLADVTVLRGLGQPFTMMPDGSVLNAARVTIVNRLDRPAEFRVAVSGIEGASLVTDPTVIIVPSGKSLMSPAQIRVPREAFKTGTARATITIFGPEDFRTNVVFTLLGPAGSAHYSAERKPEEKDDDEVGEKEGKK